MFAWIWNRSFKDLADFDVRRIEFYLHSFFPSRFKHLCASVCVHGGWSGCFRAPASARCGLAGRRCCWQLLSRRVPQAELRHDKPFWSTLMTQQSSNPRCPDLLHNSENACVPGWKHFNRFKDLSSLPRTESLFPVIEDIVNNGWVDSHSFIRKLRPLSHLPSHPFSSCINP